MRNLATIGLLLMLLVLLCGAGCVHPGAACYNDYDYGYSSQAWGSVPSYGGYGYGYGYGPGYGGYYASGGYCRD